MNTQEETSKEKFDREMANIEAYKNRSKESPEMEEEVNRVENELEKEADDWKVHEPGAPKNIKNLQEDTLKTLHKLNRRKRSPHVSAGEMKLISLASQRFKQNELDNPVLIHLLKRKEKLQNQYMECQDEAKELYQNMLTRMGEVSENTLKIQGAIESLDRELVEVLKDSGYENDLPPSA